MWTHAARPLLSRFRHTVAALTLAVGIVAISNAGVSASEPAVTVFKSPYCGCCANWVEYLREHGFDVDVHEKQNLDGVKRMAGVPGDLRSCHTAMVDGYVIEGHVPVDAIHRLLSERPNIRGLSVPGMPIGSPGMEGPGAESYAVYGFGGDADTGIYMSFPAR